MEMDKKTRSFSVTSNEAFGRLLVELMHNNSNEIDIKNTLRRVGEIVVRSYLEDEADELEELGFNDTRPLVFDDLARDTKLKAEIHARNSEITMKFSEEYFEGLARIAIREIKDLPDLYNEKEITQIAVDKCLLNEYGQFYDDQDLNMIDEEIQQAEASKEFMLMLRDYRQQA
jgi:hypothetical protein